MGTIAVLGATSRLAVPLRSALERRSQEVLLVGRRRVAERWVGPVDVTEPRWARPEPWQVLLAGCGVPPAAVAGVVNLVTRKSGSRRAVVASNVGGVRAMLGLRDAVAACGEAPFTVHVGSVSEYQERHRSAYAVGKQAARQAARDGAVDLIVTLGVVLDPTAAPVPTSVRLVLGRLPWLAATVQVPVTSVDTAAHVLAALVTSGRAALGARERRPLEARVAGQDQPLAALAGTPWPVPAPSRGERVLLRLLANLRWPRSGWPGRLLRFARIALPLDGPGRASHYQLASATQLDPSGLASAVRVGDVLVTRDPAGVQDLLVLPPSAPSAAR